MARVFAYFTCFVTGLAVLVLELIAFRLLAPYFGTSSYVVGAIINTILLALAVGYLIGGYTVDRFKSFRLPYLIVLICALYLTPIYIFYPQLLRALADYSIITGAFTAIVVMFFIPMVLLAFVPPYLIKLLLVEGKVGAASGLIFSISTVGSIIGGLLTTFLFIPYLGSQLTLLITLIILYLLCAVGFWVYRSRAAFLSALVLISLLLPPDAKPPGALYYGESEYNVITVAEAYERRWLLLNDNLGLQSVSLDPESHLAERFYTDLFLLPHMLGDVDSTLILGNAAGTTMTSLAHYFPGRIDGVEIDPTITRLGERYFGLDLNNERNRIFHEDGRIFLNQTQNRYDAVIIDMYGGGPYIPFHVATVEFFEQASKALNDNGVLAVNLPFFAENTRLERYYLATIGQVFDSAFRVKQVLYAFKQPISPESLLQQLHTRELPVALGPLRDTIIQHLTVVELRSEGPMFTDDHAPLELLTFQALSTDWLAGERAKRKELLGY